MARRGSPQPVIRWLKNGSPVGSDTGTKHRYLDDGQFLVIYSLEMSDLIEGGSPVEYQCQVTNVNVTSTVNSSTIYHLMVYTGACVP